MCMLEIEFGNRVRDELLLLCSPVPVFRQIGKPCTNYKMLARCYVKVMRDRTHFGLWYQETFLSFPQNRGYKKH